MQFGSKVTANRKTEPTSSQHLYRSCKISLYGICDHVIYFEFRKSSKFRRFEETLVSVIPHALNNIPLQNDNGFVTIPNLERSQYTAKTPSRLVTRLNNSTQQCRTCPHQLDYGVRYNRISVNRRSYVSEIHLRQELSRIFLGKIKIMEKQKNNLIHIKLLGKCCQKYLLK